MFGKWGQSAPAAYLASRNKLKTVNFDSKTQSLLLSPGGHALMSQFPEQRVF